MNDHTPHLAYFRQDAGGYHFRIRLDDQYWPAIARLTRALRTTLTYHQASREFTLPINARSLVHLSLIFPIEWAIIQEHAPKEITFTKRSACACVRAYRTQFDTPRKW